MRQLICPRGQDEQMSKIAEEDEVSCCFSLNVHFRYKTCALRHPTAFNFYNSEICLNIMCMHHLYAENTYKKLGLSSPGTTSCNPNLNCKFWSHRAMGMWPKFSPIQKKKKAYTEHFEGQTPTAAICRFEFASNGSSKWSLLVVTTDGFSLDYLGCNSFI